jgi:hypothetical protein
MLANDAGILIQNGYNTNIFIEGTQIIGSDGVMDASIWRNIPYVNVPKVMKGLLGIAPSFPFTQKRGLEFINSFINQPSTTANPFTGFCNMQMDDDGNFLYQTLIAPDFNISTVPYECLGVDFTVFKSDGSNFNPFAGYAYDAVYAAAYAAQDLIYRQKYETPSSWYNQSINPLFYEALINNVSFQGSTGLVDFSPVNSTTGTNYPEGDRLTDIFYTLFNFQPDAYLQDPTGQSGLVRSGFWTPKFGMNVCNLYENGLPVPVQGCEVIFNTPDNSVPLDGSSPPPSSGSSNSSNSYQLSDGAIAGL